MPVCDYGLVSSELLWNEESVGQKRSQSPLSDLSGQICCPVVLHSKLCAGDGGRWSVCRRMAFWMAGILFTAHLQGRNC